MPDQILGASGFFLANVTSAGKLSVDASVNASVNFDPIAGSPGGNFPGSVIMLGGVNSVTGSVGYFTSTNNKLDTNATVSMTGGSAMVIYSGALTNIVQVTGGRFYTSNLGSVEISNYTGSVHVKNVVSTIGSVEVSNTTRAVTQSTSPWVTIGSNQVSSIVGALPIGTNIIGSVAVDIQKFGVALPAGTNVIGSVNVAITKDGTAVIGSVLSWPVGTRTVLGSVEVSNTQFKPLYIIGSPNYNLPVSATVSTGSGMVLYSGAITNIANVSNGNVSIIGSVAVTSSITSTTSFDSIGGVDAKNLPTSGLVIAGINSSTGSLALLRMTSNKLDVNATVSTGSGVCLYSGAVTNIVDITSGRMGVYSLGSQQVSSIVGALPAGTLLLGSVKATPDGYYQMLGSPNYSLPVVGSVQVSSVGGTVTIGAVPVGTNIIGSVAADIQKFGVALPTGTNTIGSVGLQGAWTGVGSIYSSLDTIGSRVSFDYTTALTGSVLWTPTAGNRIGVTDIFLSSSGANLVTLFFGPTDNNSNRIVKASLVAGGGFVSNFLKPLYGHTNGSICITTAVAAPGYVTINGFEKV